MHSVTCYVTLGNNIVPKDVKIDFWLGNGGGQENLRYEKVFWFSKGPHYSSRYTVYQWYYNFLGGIRRGNVSLTLLGGGDNEKRLRNSTQGFVSCVFACSPTALRTVSDDVSKAQSERLAPSRIRLPGFPPWL